MNIDITDAEAMKLMPVYEVQDFRRRGKWRLRQILQGIQYSSARTQISQSKLTDHERMRQNFSRIEKAFEHRVFHPQMVNPNRSIDEDHARLGRRRGGATRSG